MKHTLTQPGFAGKRAIAGCLAALALLGGSAPAQAAQTPTPRGLDYSDFKIIADRNIFNPRRTAGRSATFERSQYATRRSSSRSESFALVGTMSYEKGPYAFFDSSTTQYRKVVNANDTIADCKVLRVEPNYVKLACGTNIVDLPVGMQMERQSGGGWKVAARAETYDSPSSPYSSRSSYISSGSGSSNRDRFGRTDWRSSRGGDSGRSDATGTRAFGQPGAPPSDAGGFPPVIVINGGELGTNIPMPPGSGPAEPADVVGGPDNGPSEPASTAGGSPNDILEKLRARAEASRGGP